MKNCGTCKLYVESIPPDADGEPGVGECGWSSDKLPYGLRWGARERVMVQSSDGEACTCHDEKAVIDEPLSATVRCDRCEKSLPESTIQSVFVDYATADGEKVEVEVDQCPACGNATTFTDICDESGCSNDATCGWISKTGGWRRTCGGHMRVDG